MNKNAKLIVLGFFCFRLVLSMKCDSDPVTVHTGSKIYLGCDSYNWRGEKFKSFRGIRYAKSPTDDLRFRDPIPFKDDASIVDARTDGKDCPSIFTDNASEDCLFLNENRTTPRPVIVFVHPGGFYGGSGASRFLGPEYLMEKDVVLVTFNYRLASLGFLNLGTIHVPGNAGLKDQVIALRWVRDNIRFFGGDSHNITLMGYSAGALSVCLHMVSPMSMGLFHRAIIMSGSIPPQTEFPLYNQFELARAQATRMGCNEPIASPDDIIQCLNKFSGFEIAKTLRKMFYFGKDNPIFLWLPVIERNFGQERFLIENPYASFIAGRFAKIPILIGFTDGEFCTSAQEIISDEDLTTRFNEEFKRLAPICFMYSWHSRKNEITEAIRSYYLQNTTLKEDDFPQLCDLFSDALIRFGAHTIAKLTSKYIPVYPYRFSYRGKVSNLDSPRRYAVEHMDDLMYLFQMPLVTFSPADPEAAIVELVVSFFTKFAVDGKPDQDFEFKMDKHAEIGSAITIIEGKSFFERHSFWTNIILPSLA